MPLKLNPVRAKAISERPAKCPALLNPEVVI